MNYLTPVTCNRTIEDGCLLGGSRVVVPPKRESRVVDEQHEGAIQALPSQSHSHDSMCSGLAWMVTLKRG